MQGIVLVDLAVAENYVLVWVVSFSNIRRHNGTLTKDDRVFARHMHFCP